MFRVEYAEKFSTIILEKTNKPVGLIDNSYLSEFCQSIGIAIVSNTKKEETKNGI